MLWAFVGARWLALLGAAVVLALVPLDNRGLRVVVLMAMLACIISLRLEYSLHDTHVPGAVLLLWIAGVAMGALVITRFRQSYHHRRAARQAPPL